VVLSWNSHPGATEYRIYRDTLPYFSPGAPYAVTAGNTFTDPGVVGNPNVNYYYLVGAWNGTSQTLCTNRVGKFDFGLTPGVGRLADMAFALDARAAAPNADALADSVDPNHVLQVMKWDPTLQAFLVWSNQFNFGDNFATAVGDYYFLLLDANAPTVASLVGIVPPPGSLHFTLTRAQPGGDCLPNLITLPLDHAHITNADQLADAIGTPNPPGPPSVIQTFDWRNDLQNFLAWSNAFGFGDNFPTQVGYPYLVCLSDTAPLIWP
jgi:hypothetical protein